MKKSDLRTVLKGMIVGGTMLIPGASGSSMAIILGVYDRLVSSVSSFTKHKRESFIFLLLFCLGGGLGLRLFSTPLLRMMERYPMPMLFFFLGAVAGTVPLMLRQANVIKFHWKIPVYIAFGFFVIWLIALLPADIFQSEMRAGVLSFLLLMFAGVIGAIALVLPGISFSYLLLVLGLYDETMRAITGFYMPFLVPLGIGLLLGIVLTTKALERAMTRHPQPTYLIILGFVLGSMIEVFPGVPTGGQTPVCILTLIAGFGVIWLLSSRERQQNAVELTANYLDKIE